MARSGRGRDQSDGGVVSYRRGYIPTIILDDYDKFNDGSGRQNYHSREVFRKLIIRPLPFVIP